MSSGKATAVGPGQPPSASCTHQILNCRSCPVCPAHAPAPVSPRASLLCNFASCLTSAPTALALLLRCCCAAAALGVEVRPCVSSSTSFKAPEPMSALAPWRRRCTAPTPCPRPSGQSGCPRIPPSNLLPWSRLCKPPTPSTPQSYTYYMHTYTCTQYVHTHPRPCPATALGPMSAGTEHLFRAEITTDMPPCPPHSNTQTSNLTSWSRRRSRPSRSTTRWPSAS